MVVAYEFAVASDGFDQRLAKYRSAKQCERFNLEWTKVVHMQPNARAKPRRNRAAVLASA